MMQVEDVEELPDEVTSDPEDNSKTPNLAVDITTSFPDAEVFGVKLVNGRPTRAILDVSNNEPEAVNLMVVGGSLTTPVDAPGAPDPPVVLRNLTTQRYGVQIPAGEKETLTYAFVNEMRKSNSYYIQDRYIRNADKQSRSSRSEAEYRRRPAEPGG